MANPDRDTAYTTDNRTVYSRESSSTGWFVGIIVALALLAIGYLVFSANTGPSTTTTVTTETPVTTPAPATDTTPMAPATDTTPMAPAPTETAPATEPAPATEAPVTEPAPAPGG